MTGKRLQRPPSRESFYSAVRTLSKTREYRPYQPDAAWRAMLQLEKSNVLLTLPQGTGKTFVSQLVAYGLLRSNPGMKVLVVVPAKELREQYAQMARWMGEDLQPRIAVVRFNEVVGATARSARVMADQADILVTTPQFFANRHRHLARESLDAFRLCILDEVDLWSVEDFRADEKVRFHAGIAELLAIFMGRSKFLGLTASPLTQRGAHILLDKLKLADEKPFHKSIIPYLPCTRLVPGPRSDPWIEGEDLAITKECQALFRQLTQLVSLPARSDMWGFLQMVAGGQGESAGLARRILLAQHRRVQLYEDLLGGRKAKFKMACELARKHAPSVIFCREIQAVSALSAEKPTASTATAHSNLGDQYIANIEGFKRGDSKTLVMTRDLGKRGVDFPMAKSLVVLSPKTSVTAMDQELCRTRSTVRAGEKQVYLLFYAETYEEEKLRNVLQRLVSLRMYERYQKFTLDAKWGRWLAARAHVTFSDLLRGKGAAPSKRVR